MYYTWQGQQKPCSMPARPAKTMQYASKTSKNHALRQGQQKPCTKIGAAKAMYYDGDGKYHALCMAGTAKAKTMHYGRDSNNHALYSKGSKNMH